MSNKLDLHSQFVGVKALAPIAGTDDTVLTSEIIDLQGYDGVEFFVMSGVLADAAATFTPAIFHGDASNMSDEGSALTDADSLYGAPAAWAQSDDGAVQQFGYRGSKRYLRVKITPSGNASSAPFAVLAVLRKKKVGSTL